MRKLASTFTLLLLGVTARAGETPAQTHAKAIAPYVNDQTFLVGHLDVSRLDIDMFAKLSGEDVDKTKAVGLLAKTTFLSAGGKDVYFLMNWTSRVEEMLVVAPLAKGKAHQGLAALVSQFSGYQAEVKDDVLLAGPKKAMAGLKDFQAAAMPELATAFAAVGDGSAQIIFLPPFALKRALVENYPVLPKEVGGGNTAALDFKWLAVSLDSADGLTARIVMQAGDAKTAEEIGKFARRALDLASKDKEVKRMFPDISKLIARFTPKVQSERLTVSLGDNDLKEVLLPLIQKQRDAAGRAQSMNNLKQIAIAMHNYHDVNKSFPAPANYDAQGKPLLSWRVHILPYIEQDNLYREFHLNEPWDSEHNKKLLARMPPTYRSPAQLNAAEGKTAYLVPVGPKTIFAGKTGMQIQKITDGTSNTIMVLEVNDSRSVFWTQPEDYKVDEQNPLAGLFRPGAQSTNAAFADGSVHVLPQTTSPATMRALYTANGGEILGEDAP